MCFPLPAAAENGNNKDATRNALAAISDSPGRESALPRDNHRP